MKNLNIKNDRRRVTSKKHVYSFFEKLDLEVPETLIDVFTHYEGSKLSLAEANYYDESGERYLLHVFLHLEPSYKNEATVLTILEGHKGLGVSGFVPFAIDLGGWDYCVSLNKETYEQVWVNAWTSGREDTMMYVAPSLQAFIDGLGFAKDC